MYLTPTVFGVLTLFVTPAFRSLGLWEDRMLELVRRAAHSSLLCSSFVATGIVTRGNRPLYAVILLPVAYWMSYRSASMLWVLHSVDRRPSVRATVAATAL